MQLYTSENGTRLSGLANVGDNVNNSLIATAEIIPGIPAKIRLLLLRRDAAATLHVAQSADLNETENGWASFAQWYGGNLFCAVLGSSSLHELCRSQGASQTPFDNTPRVHILPEEVIAICGLQSNGECRLAASFYDKTFRVFRVSGATLCELQIVPRPDSNFWKPRTLLALPGGSLILGSSFRDASNSQTLKYGIECCAAQPDGFLASSKRLHAPFIDFALIGLLQSIDDSSILRIVTRDTNRALCIYSLKNQDL